jgi:alpha-1,3-glucosyltransferase
LTIRHYLLISNGYSLLLRGSLTRRQCRYVQRTALFLSGSFSVSPYTPAQISSEPYTSERFMYFHRCSVVLADIVLAAGVYAFIKCRSSPPNSAIPDTPSWKAPKALTAAIIVLLQPGLYLVDHIHFQYNGLLLGALLLLLAALQARHDKLAAALFVLLACLKHVFLVLAPVLAVYLFRHYCMQIEKPALQVVSESPSARGKDSRQQQGLIHTLASIVAAAARLFFLVLQSTFLLVLVFTPVFWGSSHAPSTILAQVAERLFPFSRGLTHAYWAPNVWALYNTVDRILYRAIVATASVSRGFVDLTGWVSHAAAGATQSSGLVRDLGTVSHAVLPCIRPGWTVFLVLAAQIPALSKVWRSPHPRVLVPAVVFCQFSAFMLGWHVHEKAALYIVVPATFLAMENVSAAAWWTLLSVVASLAQVPLMNTPLELAMMPIAMCAMHVVSFWFLSLWHTQRQHSTYLKPVGVPLLTLLPPWQVWAVGSGSLAVQLCLWFFPLVLGDRMPFLRLQLTSVFCAAMMLPLWVRSFSLIWDAEVLEANHASVPQQQPQSATTTSDIQLKEKRD